MLFCTFSFSFLNEHVMLSWKEGGLWIFILDCNIVAIVLCQNGSLICVHLIITMGNIICEDKHKPIYKMVYSFRELCNLCYQPKGHYIGSLRVIVIALSLKHWSKAQVELHSEHNNRKASLREQMSSYQNKSQKSCQSFWRFTFYWPHKRIPNLQT